MNATARRLAKLKEIAEKQGWSRQRLKSMRGILLSKDDKGQAELIRSLK